MLVLSRKKNEIIVVGDAEITVVEIRGNRVRLGIQAPKELPVHRKEVLEAIHIAPKIWEKLLPRLQAQCEDRQKHGLVWSDPGEPRDMALTKLTDDPACARLVLYVDPTVSANALARAYRLPVLPPGTLHTVVRPSRPYLVVLEHDGTGESAPTDPAAVLQKEAHERWRRLRSPNPLLPLELLLLAIEHPEAFQSRGLTAAGAVYAEQPPSLEQPSMYPYNEEQVNGSLCCCVPPGSVFPKPLQIAGRPVPLGTSSGPPWGIWDSHRAAHRVKTRRCHRAWQRPFPLVPPALSRTAQAKGSRTLFLLGHAWMRPTRMTCYFLGHNEKRLFVGGPQPPT